MSENSSNNAADNVEHEVGSIEIDRHACIGADVCTVLAPGTFELDDENIAVLKDKSTWEDKQAILDAAAACPVLAIKVKAASGDQLFPETH